MIFVAYLVQISSKFSILFINELKNFISNIVTSNGFISREEPISSSYAVSIGK